MRALLRDYRSMQAEREKAFNEMHPAAMEAAGSWFKEATAPELAPESAEPRKREFADHDAAE